MRLLWALTPDGLGILVFLIAYARSLRTKGDDWAVEIVAQCAADLGLTSLDVERRDAVAQWVRGKIQTDALTEMTWVSGFISVAGAFEMAALHNSANSVLLVLPFWLAVMMYLWATAQAHPSLSKLRTNYLIVFTSYTTLALGLKVLVLYNAT